MKKLVLSIIGIAVGSAIGIAVGLLLYTGIIATGIDRATTPTSISTTYTPQELAKVCPDGRPAPEPDVRGWGC